MKSRSFRQHSGEFLFGGVNPLIGGFSGRDNMNLVSISLKALVITLAFSSEIIITACDQLVLVIKRYNEVDKAPCSVFFVDNSCISIRTALKVYILVSWL